MSESVAVPARRSLLRPLIFGLVITAVLALLFLVPWYTLVLAASWPAPVVALGTVVLLGGGVAFPVLMAAGHGRNHRDWAARTADTMLGVVWVLFVWSVLGNVLRAALAVGGVADPARGRVVAVSALAVSVVLLAWGYVEAMRVPRVKRVDVPIARLGAGLDGLRVVLLTDTHYGPINRARWSNRVIDAVNELDADVQPHTDHDRDPAHRDRAERHERHVFGHRELGAEQQSCRPGRTQRADDERKFA